MDLTDNWEHAPDEVERIWSASAPGGVEWIKRRDIPALVENETAITAWNEWQRWKRFGLPHGAGPFAERPQWLKAVEIVDQEYLYYQQKQMEK